MHSPRVLLSRRAAQDPLPPARFAAGQLVQAYADRDDLGLPSLRIVDHSHCDWHGRARGRRGPERDPQVLAERPSQHNHRGPARARGECQQVQAGTHAGTRVEDEVDWRRHLQSSERSPDRKHQARLQACKVEERAVDAGQRAALLLKGTAAWHAYSRGILVAAQHEYGIDCSEEV
eukprot:scaffold7181_cov113-Isochrysis_galbana.AAC.1